MFPMGGPSAAVLTRVELDEAALAPLREFIAAVSSEVNGNDFWVAHAERIWTKPYDAMSGPAVRHLLSPNALRAWLEHQDFRMVK
jgi:hypothetical protein